jgi:hypothetical protein
VVDVKAGGNGFDSRRLHHYFSTLRVNFAFGAQLVPTRDTPPHGNRGEMRDYPTIGSMSLGAHPYSPNAHALACMRVYAAGINSINSR